MPWGFLGGIASGIGQLFGQKSAAKEARKAADRAYKRNKEAAQNAISWRVADAKKAGIHPLAALGASTVGPLATPVSSGSGGAGSAVAAGLSRAFQSLAAERSELENELLRAQIKQSDSVADWYTARSRTLEQSARAQAVGGTTGQIAPPGTVMGLSIAPDSSTSDAEWFQRRYGELGEWAAAPVIAAQDIEHNTGMPATWRALNYGRKALEHFWKGD